jgi:anti-sigma factor RsiW
MHNCRLTKNRLLDLTLDEVKPAEAKQLLEELDDCPACQEEYATLRNTWRASVQALRSALPTEDFWPAYHDRLQARLITNSSPVKPVRLSLNSRLWIGLRKMATTSVRVPAPAALAMMLLVGIFFLVLRSRGQANVTPSTPLPSVETRTVQVPVIQEKVVTRVVYVEKKGRRSRGGASQLDRPETNNVANSVARAGSDASGKTAMSLIGFKPTDQVKLTIIKGRHQDEK